MFIGKMMNSVLYMLSLCFLLDIYIEVCHSEYDAYCMPKVRGKTWARIMNLSVVSTIDSS